MSVDTVNQNEIMERDFQFYMDFNVFRRRIEKSAPSAKNMFAKYYQPIPFTYQSEEPMPLPYFPFEGDLDLVMALGNAGIFEMDAITQYISLSAPVKVADGTYEFGEEKIREWLYGELPYLFEHACDILYADYKYEHKNEQLELSIQRTDVPYLDIEEAQNHEIVVYITDLIMYVLECMVTQNGKDFIEIPEKCYFSDYHLAARSIEYNIYHRILQVYNPSMAEKWVEKEHLLDQASIVLEYRFIE